MAESRIERVKRLDKYYRAAGYTPSSEDQRERRKATVTTPQRTVTTPTAQRTVTTPTTQRTPTTAEKYAASRKPKSKFDVAMDEMGYNLVSAVAPIGEYIAKRNAKNQARYEKYNKLSDEEKNLVKTASLDTRGQFDTLSYDKEGVDAYEKLLKKYSRDEIVELKKGYGQAKKYGTPITENEEVTAKYDKLDSRGKDLLQLSYSNPTRTLRDTLKKDYGLSDNDIEVLSIYAKRKHDAAINNDEFWQQAGKESAEKHPRLTSVASVGSQALGTVSGLGGAIQDLGENRRLKKAGYEGDLTLNTDNPAYALRNFTKSARQQRGEDVGEYWQEKTGSEYAGKAANFVYQTAMSGADSLVAGRISAALPAVNFGGVVNGAKNTVSIGQMAGDAAYSLSAGGLMLGVGAGIDTMLDLADKGASAQTAVLGGLVSGTFEMLFEDLSISNMERFKGIEALKMDKGRTMNAILNNLAVSGRKILGSTVTNASEEGLTEIAGLIYDTVANGEMSQFTDYYNKALEDGKSEQEAKRIAAKEMALQVLEAAAGGALMGFGFGIGGSVNMAYNRNKTYASTPNSEVRISKPKDMGAELVTRGYKDGVIKAADVVGGAAQEYKNKIVDKAGGEDNLSEKELGKIAQETLFATEGNEEKQKAFQKVMTEAKEKSDKEAADNVHFAITNSPIVVDGKQTALKSNKITDEKGNVFHEVFRKGKNGVEFETGDGRTVQLTKETASQIENSDARQLAEFAVKNNFGADSANLLFNTYNGDRSASDHANPFLTVYRQGALGTKGRTLIEYYREAADRFTADQVKAITEAGLKEKQKVAGVTDWRVKKSDPFINAQVKIMDLVGKALDKEYFITDELYDKYTDKDGNVSYRYLNGTFLPDKSGKENRIILSAKADNGLLLSYLGHEMGHEMKRIDSDAYAELEKVVRDYYTDEEFEKMKKNFVSRGYSEDEAAEEIICNSLFKVWNGRTIEKVLGKKKATAVKLAELVSSIANAYSDALDLYTADGRNADIKKLIDQKEYAQRVEKVFDDFLERYKNGEYKESANTPSSNSQGENSLSDRGEKEFVDQLGKGAEVETDKDGNLVLATDKEEKTAMYSYSTWESRGRDALINLLKEKGHTQEEIKDVVSQIEDAADYLKILAAGDAKNAGYDALADHLIADVTTDVANGKQIVSALVPNGDYPVNIDLALICKKRVAYMNLLNYLVKEGVLENVKFGGEAIADVNKVLRDSGFETACLGCFVESRRLQIQTWAETIAQEWNAAVDAVRKDAPYFNFAEKDGATNLTDDEINDLESWLNKQEQNDKGNVKAPGKTPTTKAANLLKMLQETGEGEAFNALAKKITVGDLITPQGLTKLRSVSGELFSFVKSRYGAASPKIVQDFNPYNSEIAMMTFAAVKNITGSSITGSTSYLNEAKKELADSKPSSKNKAALEKWNADVQNLALQNYFKDIGGIRIQSFSDFMIENVFDYMQIVADLSARDFTMHGYTKEAVALRLFGMTGIKWNGSLIAHVDSKMGKELAGLMPASEAKAHRGILVKVDGKEYAIGFDDYERHSKFDKNSFIQSIGYKDIVALQCDKRYSPYVGSICIGVSDNQIKAMLDCGLIRMVIPYHASGMLPEFANLIGVDLYTDYTDSQNTKLGKLFDLNGKAVKELIIGKDKNGKNEVAGSKQVEHFEWNAKVQELGDAKAAADAYLEWCKERHPVKNKQGEIIGYAEYEPKFSQFSDHKNYYKLLEDFNSYDSVTGESAVQDAVKMNLPSKDNKLTAKELAEYKRALKKTGLFSDAEIEKYAKKAQMSFQDIIKEAVNERIAYNKITGQIKEETFSKVKDLLLKKYNRNDNRAASIEDYLNAQKSPSTKSALQPVEGAYGEAKRSYSDRGAIAEEDTQGQKLSEGQREFFKDSEAVDAKGRLVRLLHGSKLLGFMTFDNSVKDSNEIGYFATTSRDVAFSYSGSYDEYAPTRAKSWDEITQRAMDVDLFVQQNVDDNTYSVGVINWDGDFEEWRRFDSTPKGIEQADKMITDWVQDELEGYGKPGMYEVYYNLTNPLIIDGKGSDWDNVIDYPEGYEWVDSSQLTDEQVYLAAQEILDMYPGSELNEWFVENDIDDVHKVDVEELRDMLPGDNEPSHNYGAIYGIGDGEVILADSQGKSTRDWVEEAYYAGYDGVIFKNIVDTGPEYRYAPESDVYVAFNRDQIKSTANLNPTHDDDIRYSRSDREYISDGEKKYLANLKKSTYNEYQTNLMIWFHGSAEKGSLKILYQPKSKSWVLFEKGDDAPILLKSSKNFKEVREEYDRLYDEANARFDSSIESARNRQADHSRNMLYDRDGEGIGQDNRPALRRQGRNDGSESGADLPEGNSRKGIVEIERSTDNGGALSDAQNSLSERGDVNEYEAEQLLENATKEEAKTIVDKVDRELLGDAMYYGRKAEELRAEKNAKTKEVKSLEGKVETRNRQIAKLRQDMKKQRLADDIYYARRMKEIREDRDQKLIAQKVATKEAAAKRKENALRTDYKERINRQYDKLSRELTKPNANKYVPAELVKTVADVLGRVSDTLQQAETYNNGKTINSHIERNANLDTLKRVYDSLANDDRYPNAYDPVIAEYMQGVSDMTQGRTLDQMTSAELAEVNNLLKALDHTIRNSRKVTIKGKESDAFKLADSMIDELADTKRKKINKFTKFWYDQMNPYSFFRQLSGYAEDSSWVKMYDLLNEGQLKKTQIMADITEAFNELTTDKQLFDLRDQKKTYDIGLKDKKGNPIMVTKGLMISMYMSLQNEDNARHISGGGAVVPDLKRYYGGDKSEAYGADVSRSSGVSGDLRSLNYRINNLDERRKALKREGRGTTSLEEQIADLENQREALLNDADAMSEYLRLNIEKQLNDYDRKWIEKSRWLFDEYSKEKLNDATMDMYGFRKAEVNNYFPIVVDKTSIEPSFESVRRDASLENAGFMKERTKSYKPVYIEDIVDVVNRQMNNVATYAGLAPALKDFNKVYGKSKLGENNEITSVQRAVVDTFGNYGRNYISDLVADLQGARKGKGSLGWLRGRAYQAALTLNLRVAMAQAGSYPTAAAEIGWTPLLKGFKKGLSSADRELIAKYSPLLANRLNGGNSQIDLNNAAEFTAPGLEGLTRKAMKKTQYLTDWISKIDVATVGRLWYAAEYYVDDNFDLEKGTDEYYKQVAEVFNRIVERTQPSYTTMQRTALLRNPSEGLKFFTMYMTQRAQNFNLMYDSVMEYNTLLQGKKNGTVSDERLRESRNKLTRVVSSQIAAAATLSAFKILADALQHNMRKYRDDDDEVKAKKIFESFGETVLESVFSNVFLGSEVYSILNSILTKETYYGMSVNVTGLLTDITKDIAKLGDPSAKSIDKLLRDAATLVGVPSSQIQKFVNMGKYWIQDIVDGGGIYSAVEGEGSSTKVKTKKMIEAYLKGDIPQFKTRSDMLSDVSADSVKSAITSYINEEYLAGNLTDQQVHSLMMNVYYRGLSYEEKMKKKKDVEKRIETLRQKKNGTYEKKESKKWGGE